MKTLITDRTLRGLKPAPAGKRTVIWDTAVPGLCKGAISFSVMRRIKGSSAPVRRMLGVAWTVPFPASQQLPYPLATAREDARAMIIDMSRGIDPKARLAAKEREDAARKANSFSAVAEKFIVKHVRKLRTGAAIESAIRRELIARWAERPITEISRRDVVEMVEDVANSGGALPVPSNVAELCIAHAQPGLHRVYDLHGYRDEKRRAFELWAARLAEIIEPESAGNILRFRTA